MAFPEGIGDPELNCLTLSCCGLAAAKRTLVKIMVAAGGDRAYAKAFADWWYEYFDVLPKGTVNLTKVLELARQPNATDEDTGTDIG